MTPIVVILTIATIVAGCAPSGLAPSSGSGGSAGPASAGPASAEPRSLAPSDASGAPGSAGATRRLEVDARIPVPLPVLTLLATEDAVWAAGEGHAYRLDPATNAIVEDIDLGFGFEGNALAFAAGRLWAASFELNVVRSHDLETGATEDVQVAGNPDFLLAAHDAIWVAQHRAGSVARIDPESATVVSSLRIGPPGPGGPAGMTATPEGVWVAVPLHRTVVLIDREGTAEARRYEVEGSAPCGVGFVVDRLWVGTCFDFAPQLEVVDPVTAESRGRILLEAFPAGVVELGDSVWIPTVREFPPLPGDGEILVIDPLSLEARGRLTVEAQGPAIAAFGSLWLADAARLQVLRIDVPGT